MTDSKIENKNTMLEVLPANANESGLVEWTTKAAAKELSSVMLFPQNNQEKNIAYLHELAINTAVMMRDSEYLGKVFTTPAGKQSLTDAIRQCAKFGLMVGGAMPTAYFVPRRKKVFMNGQEQHVWTANFLATAIGYVSVVKKFKVVKDVQWWVNYEYDYVEIDRVSGEATVVEKPTKDTGYRKGGMIGVAVQIIFEDGTKKGNNYAQDWILRQKENAKKANGFVSKSWDTHPEDKWSITCIRNMCKPFVKEGTTHQAIIDLEYEPTEPIKDMGDYAADVMTDPVMQEAPDVVEPETVTMNDVAAERENKEPEKTEDDSDIFDADD